MPNPLALSMADLVDRARSMAVRDERAILGIVGAPGAGKSTVAQRLVDALGDLAVLVPMDGYHFANEVLLDLGRRDRKGAPDTFDATGYIALLERLRDQRDDIIYAPRFARDLEEPIGSALPVRRETPLVITEGNYLLVPDAPWAPVRGLLDESWYLLPNEELRKERLIARHIEFGKEPEAARAWALGTDERNAVLIHRTAAYADLVIDLQ